MKKIMSRLREPSTWAGLSAIGLLFGVPVGSLDLIAQAGIAIAGAAAVLLPESENGERRGRGERRKVAVKNA
jgi:hypothetical protein